MLGFSHTYTKEVNTRQIQLGDAKPGTPELRVSWFL